MRILTFCLLLMSTSTTFSQTVTRFDSAQVTTIIAGKTDTLHSIFQWVATNIEYDLESLNDLPSYQHPSELLEMVWTQRRGVCMHYAELFNAFCQYLDYEAAVVTGYSSYQGIEDGKYGHSWNAVKVGKEWYLFDPTWAAGYRQGERFIKKYDPKWYKVKPEKFLKTHIPYDPLWQLLKTPLSKAEIVGKKPSKKLKHLHYQQLIQQSYSLSPIDKDQATLLRIKDFQDDNPLAIRERERIENNIQIQKFKEGVTAYNQSIDAFNEFIKGYNQRFSRDRWTDDFIRTQLQQINQKLDKALTTFNQLDPLHPHYGESLAHNLNLLREYRVRVQRVNEFTTKYLNTWRLFRWTVDLH